MSEQNIFWGSVIGFFTVCILGTFFHFLYGLSGNSTAVALFTPVNESVWEHLKLLFFPSLFYSIAELIVYGRKICGFLFSRTVGIIAGLIFMPAAFMLYSTILGRSYVVIDILIFIISVFLTYYIGYSRLKKGTDCSSKKTLAAVIILSGVALLMSGLTFDPPSTPLFRDPTAIEG